MKTTLITFILGLSGLTLIGQTPAPIQSSARPYGLNIVDKVQAAASDEASLKFQKNYLPSISDLVNVSLGERATLNNGSLLGVDPSKLTMLTDSNVRAYFVGEGAGYQNTLGFTVSPAGTPAKAALTPTSELIFPNVSTSADYMTKGAQSIRTTSTPLLPGDFVELGQINAGNRLDFFLISNGASGGRTVFSTDTSLNPDGISHVVSFAMQNSPYLIIAFEDLLGGGDKDYNDTVFALYVGEANIRRLISTPEPGLWIVLPLLLVVAYGLNKFRGEKETASVVA